MKTVLAPIWTWLIISLLTVTRQQITLSKMHIECLLCALGFSTTKQCWNFEHRHKWVLDQVTIDYMKLTTKRQKSYDDAVRQQRYAEGDIAGLQKDTVDRINTIPKVSSCKVISLNILLNGSTMYELCRLEGFLSVSYGVSDLLDWRNSKLTLLNYGMLFQQFYQQLRLHKHEKTLLH